MLIESWRSSQSSEHLHLPADVQHLHKNIMKYHHVTSSEFHPAATTDGPGTGRGGRERTTQSGEVSLTDGGEDPTCFNLLERFRR